MIKVHPTAVISPEAKLGQDVTIGPYVVIEDHVEVGSGSVLGPHVVLHSFLRLASRVQVGPHAVLGGAPQDLSFEPKETWAEIGEGCVLREGVTVHRATRTDRPTRVGAGAYLMAYAHVAHDCQVGPGAILTNNVGLSGHVEVGAGAIMGGFSGVHQFVRIGAGAMVGGLSKVAQDVLPYTLVEGHPALHYHLNVVGLRRKGVGKERRAVLSQAFFRVRAFGLEAELSDLEPIPELAVFAAFLAGRSERGLSGFVHG